MNTLTQNEATVNPDSVYFIIDAETDLSQLLDDIYPFDPPKGDTQGYSNGSGDQWIIVIDCQPANYARDFGVACTQYADALRVKKEHVTRNPANGLGSWWTVRTADYTASVDRETGEVSYEDC